MIAQLIEEISNQAQLQDSDSRALAELLPLVFEGMKQMNISLNQERRLALGVHLAAFVKRIETGEYLAPVDQSVLEQVDAHVLNTSREILDKYAQKFNRKADNTEALLLAVHFEAARNN